MNEKKWWYFTIKEGTKHRKKWFKIYGTIMSARREANKRYHNDWEAQFAEELWFAMIDGKGIEEFLDEDEDGTKQGKEV